MENLYFFFVCLVRSLRYNKNTKFIKCTSYVTLLYFSVVIKVKHCAEG